MVIVVAKVDARCCVYLLGVHLRLIFKENIHSTSYYLSGRLQKVEALHLQPSGIVTIGAQDATGGDKGLSLN